MPRWPEGHISKRTCPTCEGPKDFNAETCRACQPKPVGCLGRKGSDHPAWKGGLARDKDGYLKRYVPDHPWPRKGGYVREHVRVMELALGRRLTPGEIVHHRDGDINNNDLANLEVMSAGAHSRHHRLLEKRVRDERGRFVGGDA